MISYFLRASSTPRRKLNPRRTLCDFGETRYQIEQVTNGPRTDGLKNEPVGVVFALDSAFENSHLQAELLKQYAAGASDKLAVTDRRLVCGFLAEGRYGESREKEQRFGDRIFLESQRNQESARKVRTDALGTLPALVRLWTTEACNDAAFSIAQTPWQTLLCRRRPCWFRQTHWGQPS